MNIVRLNENHSNIPVEYYEAGMRNNLFQRYWHQKKNREIAKLAMNTPGRLLDLGCHSGYLTDLIRIASGSREVFGVDISEKAISYAKNKYPSIRFEVADLNNSLLGFPDKFQLITCFDVLEHLLYPEKVIKQIYDLLLPGGLFIIGIPSESFIWQVVWWLWTHLSVGKVWRETHQRKVNPRVLVSIVNKIGFKTVQEKRIHLGAYYLAKMTKGE